MQELLKKYQSQLKLNDWNVTLIEDESINADAETFLIFNDYKATVKIKKTLNSEEKEKA